MEQVRAKWLSFYAERVEPVSKEIFSHVEKMIIGTLIVSAGAHVSSNEPAIVLFGYLRHGLIGRGVMLLGVILLMLNSTDLKDSNNSIYETERPWDGASRWYVVRDLGAALGETGKLFPRRNWLEGFEKEGFITGVSGNEIEFDYGGRHRELLSMIGPDDVKWAAEQMRRLTDAQWRDAFRAGNYSAVQMDRFIRRIKEKIADGLALRVDRRALDEEDAR